MSSTRSKRKLTTVSRRRRVSSSSLGKDSGSRKRSQGEPDATWTSGNIFKDIDVPNADEVLFKVDLAIAIGDALRRRRLTQRSAAEIARIDQPKISALLSGDIRGFS